MTSFNLIVYFYNRFTTFPIPETLLYKDLLSSIEGTFGLARKHFILQIYDNRFRTYVEFDDEHIDWLRERLPKTSVTTVPGRIVPRRRIIRHLSPRLISVASINNDLRRHQLIWLDEHIGSPRNYRRLKRQFYNSTSVDHFDVQTDISTDMIDVLISDRDNPFDTNAMRDFTAFENLESCLHFLSKSNPSLTTTLITSNHLGLHILPCLDHLNDISVYVLQNDWCNIEWGFDYLDRLQMFDHDQTLLIKITRDLARHYLNKAKLCLQSQFELNGIIEAVQYFRWARLLYERADYLDKTRIAAKTIANINEEIDVYELTMDEMIVQLDDDSTGLAKEAL